MSYTREHFPEAVIGEGTANAVVVGGMGGNLQAPQWEGPIKKKRKFEIHVLNSRVLEMEEAR